MPVQASQVPPHGYRELESALCFPATDSSLSDDGSFSLGEHFTFCTRPGNCVDGLDQIWCPPPRATISLPPPFESRRSFLGIIAEKRDEAPLFISHSEAMHSHKVLVAVSCARRDARIVPVRRRAARHRRGHRPSFQVRELRKTPPLEERPSCLSHFSARLHFLVFGLGLTPRTMCPSVPSSNGRRSLRRCPTSARHRPRSSPQLLAPPCRRQGRQLRLLNGPRR